MEELLAKCSLFKNLKPGEVEAFLAEISFQKKEYDKEQIIAYADAVVNSLLILLDGSVRGEMMDYSGKTIKIEDIEGPNLLAPAFLFGSNNKFPVTIVVNKKALVLLIPKNSFIRLLQLSDQVLSNFLDNISNRAQFLSNKLRFLSFQSVKGKIAHFLLQLSKKIGKDEFVLPKSQNELAEMFGVTRPSVGRTMRELDAEGIIQAVGKNVKIVDKAKLVGLLK